MQPMFGPPALGPDTLDARDYQVAAIEAVRNEIRKGRRSTLIVHPTGTGKTITMSKVCRYAVEKGNRALVVAHRGELISQQANALERVGLMPAIEKGQSKARDTFDAESVVGSVQTLKGNRLLSWPRDHFGVLLIDEAHHATSASFRAIIDHFHTAKVIGVTATPDRADGEPLVPDVFESVAHEMTIWEAMTAPHPGPYLCRLKYCRLDIGVNLKELRPGKSDFTAEDLEARIRPMVDTIANSVRQEVGDRPTIIFTPLIPSATAMASALRDSLGLKADWVSGDCPDRDAKVARFRNGETQFICNADMLTEGFDAPRTAAVVLCRPTKSRGLYSQMIGRGTRLGKPDCLIIDFDYMTEKHDLVRPADLFSNAEADREAVAIANKILEENPGLDFLDVIEEAKAKAVDAKHARQQLECRIREREVQYRVKTVLDPLGARKAGSQSHLPMSASHDLATPKMVGFLKYRGHANASGYSKRYAGRLIGIIKQQEARGQASA